MPINTSAKFMKFDLGKLTSGRIVEVYLSGSVANVKLLDHLNMYNYEHGREYEYTGGLAKKSPYQVTVPANEHWYLVVDTKQLEGIQGEVTASVKILS